MLQIAVVDDEKEAALTLKGYIEKYFEEKEEQYHVTIYANGLNFLDDFTGKFDIIFMDIEMPHLNGIETARKMRKIDASVVLVFVTNMAQYAIRGYEVNAIEFMVKPVGYYNFADKMEKALTFVQRNTERSMVLHNQDEIARVRISDIYYLEKDRNYIVFHTKSGLFRERGTMAEMEEQLVGSGFSKCIAGCLVNLRHVTKMSKDEVWIQETCLPISRQQKKVFVTEFAEFYGGI